MRRWVVYISLRWTCAYVFNNNFMSIGITSTGNIIFIWNINIVENFVEVELNVKKSVISTAKPV